MKITINNEEVLCNKDFTINEEMLNTSSVILNNVYPVEWEQDKDYTSRFYYPKDYSKCKIFDEIEHPSTREDAEGTSFSINVDTTKQYQVQTLKGQTTQSGTPTPSSPIPINITTGRQVVSVCGKNIFRPYGEEKTITSVNVQFTRNANGTITINGTSNNAGYVEVLYAFQNGTTQQSTPTLPLDTSTQYKLTFVNLSGTTTSIDTRFVYQYNSTGSQATIYPGNSQTISNCDGLYRAYIRIPSGVTFNNYVVGIQIAVGNDTTYEEYKGNDYDINLGKNLFNIANGTYTNGNVSAVVDNNVITINGTSGSSASTIAIPFTTTLDGTYTFSAYNSAIGTSSNWTGMRLKQTSSSTIGTTQMAFTNANASKTTTLSNIGVQYFELRLGTSTTFDNFVITPQLEKGTGTSYSPYKTPIYLGKIGTYQDYIFRNTTENPLYDENLEEGQWYIHKEIGRVVLNGSEDNWNSSTANYYLPINDIKLGSTCYSNYFVNSTTLGTFGYFRVPTTQHWLIFMSVSSQYTYQQWKTWLSTHNVEVCYVLNTPTNTLIEDEELINQLNAIELLEGLNNVSVSSANLPFIMNLMYNYQEGYTEEELYFCGVVENTGNISLNPRHPHYCNLQVLDFKTFLSEGETLDIVIYEKTILEAIEQIIGVIAPYGFVKGNINIYHADEMIGAYSTKDKTAYDVFNYIADITQSRWTTRMVDENTIAIDFYDPNLMPQGTAIQYNNTWFTNNKIIDMNFNYSSRDYRNKQVMLSGEVYSNVETTEIMVADGYQTQFNTTGKIGYVSNVLLNGTPASIITKEEYDLGYDGDFIYQPGNTYFESENLIPNGAIITIVYYAIIEGREVLLNQDEIEKINTMTNRKGVVARYETRNDATTTKELNQIGQSYLKYKGMPEITLKVESLENIWNIGERVEFNSPLEELSTEYMVKKKTINYITTQDNLFYTFELSSNFNSETEINYFDNQRAKTIGNIGSGEFISRNIDIENTANVIFYGLEVNEVQISGESTLQSELQTPLGVE